MSASHKTEFLGTQPIFSLLIKMSVPAAVGMIVNALYNIVDTIFVGQGVGAPLGELRRAAPDVRCLFYPFQMIGTRAYCAGRSSTSVAASIASRRLGEKNVESAPRNSRRNRLCCRFHCHHFSASGYWCSRCMQAADIEFSYGCAGRILFTVCAVEYMEVVSGVFSSFTLSMCASNLDPGPKGMRRAAMRGSAIGAVAQYHPLIPYFIFGFDIGCPGRAAIATVISRLDRAF
jgi:Na+-driven multidrug efflux pump